MKKILPVILALFIVAIAFVAGYLLTYRFRVFSPKTAGPKETSIVANSEEAAIKQAVAQAFAKDLSEIDIKINMITSAHASGTAKIPAENTGGWWLAAVDNGTWVVPDFGQSQVLCSKIDKYNFPTDMVPECLFLPEDENEPGYVLKR